MTDLRTELTRHVGPGFLAGITQGDWLRLLIANGFSISPRHWGRAAAISAAAPLSSVFRIIENALYGKAINQTPLAPPVFILGSWRSGTTYLHTLLSTDQRFGCPNLFQTMYPHSFLLSEWWWKPLLDLATPRKRFMDNMKMSLSEPHEDEMALAIMTLCSNMLAWVFPRRHQHYERYLSFDHATPYERTAWKNALRYFVHKVAYKTGRQIVLKSPNHTARIRLILETFPDARFLHIRRHPLDVYRSMCHMASQVIPMWGLQTYPHESIPDMVIAWYRDLYDAYFDQLPMIPAGQFHEVSYEEVVADPVGQIRAAYDALGLPDFSQAEPELKSYIASQSGYRKNQHTGLDSTVRERLHREWTRCFQEWKLDQ